MGKSVEARIISRLGKFVDVLAANKPIAKEFTCRTVVLDLGTVPYNEKMVKATRRLLRASQMIFAKFLGVSVATVRGWEQGTVAPGKMACRFLDEIRRNPDFWRGRLSESVRIKRETA
jgi:putative transcriptional regulator